MIWAANAPEIESGGYYYDLKARRVAAQGRDDEAAERLWEVSEALVAEVLGG